MSDDLYMDAHLIGDNVKNPGLVKSEPRYRKGDQTNEYNINLKAAKRYVNRELYAALQKFPNWPVSVFEGEAIVNEEVGEATKAVVDYFLHDNGNRNDCILEHAQAAAMHLRQIARLLNA